MEIVDQDTLFCRFMDEHSYSDAFKARESMLSPSLYVLVRVLTTGLHPIDCVTGIPVTQSIELWDLYYMIKDGILTPNGKKMQSSSFCRLVLNSQVLQWSSICRSIIDYYRSNNITFDMISGKTNFNKLTIYLTVCTIDETTYLDTSNMNTLINGNAKLNFNDICCVRWTKNSKYCWYGNPKKIIINSNIIVDHSDGYYSCDSIDQFTLIDV